MLGFDWKKGLSRFVGASLAVVVLTVVGAVSPAHALPTVTLTPLDNATGVVEAANFGMIFSENVMGQVGGTVTIKKTSGDVLIEVIQANDNTKILGSSTSSIEINPTANLDPNTE